MARARQALEGRPAKLGGPAFDPALGGTGSRDLRADPCPDAADGQATHYKPFVTIVAAAAAGWPTDVGRRTRLELAGGAGLPACECRGLLLSADGSARIHSTSVSWGEAVLPVLDDPAPLGDP
jgi:hypothetical protein